MFCGNCGAQNPDGSVFCSECGATLTPETVPSPSGGGTTKPSGNKNKVIGIAAIGIVVVAVVVILLVVFLGGGGNKAESVAVDFIESVYEMDAKKFVNLAPDCTIEQYAEEEDLSTSKAKKELIDYLQDSLDDLEYVLGDVKSLSVEVTDKDDMRSSELEDIQELYEDEFDVKVKAGQNIECEVSGKYDGEKFEFTVDVPVIKIGGSWYIELDSSYSLLYDLVYNLMYSY